MKHLLLIVELLTTITPIALAHGKDSRHSHWNIGQTVETTSGPVSGHAASNKPEVSEYLGIPYAQPPVGDLRFQPPVRHYGGALIKATTFGFTCMPSNISASDDKMPNNLVREWGITNVGLDILSDITNTNLSFSEDCLTLNVWTKPQVGERRKAVLVYLHGGSFVSGGSALPIYNGQFFADQEDVVLVTVNYRLTIFGFPGNPIGHPNLGLLDQRLAMKWVRDNIASFGGDPSRITLFGESAGAVSVDHYTYAWKDDPIAHAFIAQSGTAAGISLLDKATAESFWFNASATIGCGDADTPPDKVYACMRAKPAKEITNGLINTVDSPVSFPYGPTIDGILVFKNHTRRVPAARPLLIGHNDFEMGLFRVFVEKDSVPLNHWPQAGQQSFVCPAASRAALSVHHGNPTWRYRYFGTFPNMVLSKHPPSGAYHLAEVPVLFGTVKESRIANTADEIELGNYMRGAWAAFAKNPTDGLERYGGGWPQYHEKKRSLVRLGYHNQSELSIGIGNMYDNGC